MRNDATVIKSNAVCTFLFFLIEKKKIIFLYRTIKNQNIRFFYVNLSEQLEKEINEGAISRQSQKQK